VSNEVEEKRAGIRRRGRHFLVAAVALAALSLGVAACGSDDSDSSGNSGGSGSADVSSFEAKLAKYQETYPAEWSGPTDPVKPPKNFKVAGITCFSQLEGCLSPIVGAQHAAEDLGWEFNTYDGEGDPTVQAKRMQQAISSGADAIITSAVNGDLISGELAQAKKAGIIVVSTSNSTKPGEQGFVLDTSPNIEQIGHGVGAWMAADSGGEAVVAPFLDNEFVTNIQFDKGIKAELAECDGCEVKPTTDFVATDVATALGPQTVQFLQENPDVDYFYSTYDPAMASQVAAVAQAGLDVQSCSQLGNAQNLQFIREGNIQACDGAWDNEYEGYATIDQIARLATDTPPWVTEGVPERYKYGENIPYALIDKSNLPEGDEAFTADYDYVSEYHKLWGIK
jgi:ribose transport system substrate-binding protein